VRLYLVGAGASLVGEKNLRIFKFLSWASLVAGVLFVLLVPLGVSSGFRSISKTISNSVANQPTDDTDETVTESTEQSYDIRRAQ